MPDPAPPAPLWLTEAAGTAAPGERQLLAAIERLARAPQGWSAVILHLSRLPPPGPLAYHRRIARVVMQDAAQRSDGQVFVLRNTDLVLLAREGMQPAVAPAERLRALFARATGEHGAIVSDWKLPLAGAVLLAYTVDRLDDPETPHAEDAAVPPAGLVDAMAAAIAGALPQDLVQRQSAVRLDPAGGTSGVGVHVAYRELTCSPDRLPAQPDKPPHLDRDPVLLRHLGRALDGRLLQILAADCGSLSPLDPCAGAGAVSALHLNLSLPGVLSDGFAALAAGRGADAPALGVEVALVEAVADPGAFAQARARLRGSGVRLVLDGVSHLALLLARPGALQADLLKLDWSPRIAELPGAEQAELARALADAGPARVVLHQADSEAAVRWGLGQRIRLFQGHHIDQMLAVQRMLGCPGAGACTLRQCGDRAAATGDAARAGCTNLPLLDAGLPAGGRA